MSDMRRFLTEMQFKGAWGLLLPSRIEKVYVKKHTNSEDEYKSELKKYESLVKMMQPHQNQLIFVMIIKKDEFVSAFYVYENDLAIYECKDYMYMICDTRDRYEMFTDWTYKEVMQQLQKRESISPAELEFLSKEENLATLPRIKLKEQDIRPNSKYSHHNDLVRYCKPTEPWPF
jgi:hypothetical protein